ncbi:M3 family metallopeptidase [Nevskia sp.]|uniref:M3 family metallopeptidase n=1 Tax=Nevskia sp. TaxID=1929292 RepID=UPI0025D979B0|nr:M3 family metallopeptidase [Nevskia sp.]
MKNRRLLPVVTSLLIAASVPLAHAEALDPANPLARPSTLPLQYPPFDQIRNEHFQPAIEAGMAEQLVEIDAITANPDAPSFGNTVLALEQSGDLFERALTVFSNLNATNTNPEMQKIQQAIAPKLAAHRDAIFLNPKLFARVKAVAESPAAKVLDGESAQLLARTLAQFTRAGAGLDEAQKTRLRELNGQLSKLTTQFQQNVRASTKDGAVVVNDATELAGFSGSQIAAAAEAAKTRGLDGKYLITLQNTTLQPGLQQLKNRALRERLYRASVARSTSGPNDNRPVVAEIVKLRAERAKLLGYPNHAAWVLEDETAGSVEAVNRMLAELAPAATANAAREAAEIQKLIDTQEKAAGRKPFKLAPWDWPFYAEQVRAATYDFSDDDVRPYFEITNVLEKGVFFAAEKLYGITFKRRTDLPLYHPDTRVYDVFDRDGTQLGLFTADNYARDSKQGGAWMNSYVVQSSLTGLKPVVANHLNVPKPSGDQPTLLSFDEVTTIFHEFGHAAHGLFANAKYPSLSGTAVPRDFVEYPSQYNEMWGRDPAVLANFARHYQTGQPLPQALLDKVLAAARFNQGFKTTEYLASAILDQRWHQLEAGKTPDADGVLAFEAAALKSAGVALPTVDPRYHTQYFSHVFSGGYAAGYYAYIWSDVLARDTESWMKRHGGLDRANGDFLRAKVLSRGRSADVLTLFRAFYGTEPDIAPLLEHRGLELPKAKPAKAAATSR